MSSKAEFSQVMEVEFRNLFASFNAKKEQTTGVSKKQLAKTSSTSISVEGGDQEIAAVITDFNSPTIKYDLTQWLDSIRTYPKPFKFMVGPIIDLLKFNPSSLFPDEKRDWGCEKNANILKTDPTTKEKYYEVKINDKLTRKLCPYKDRTELVMVIERRRKGLERAVAVYMEEVKHVKNLILILNIFTYKTITITIKLERFYVEGLKTPVNQRNYPGKSRKMQTTR